MTMINNVSFLKILKLTKAWLLNQIQINLIVFKFLVFLFYNYFFFFKFEMKQTQNSEDIDDIEDLIDDKVFIKI